MESGREVKGKNQNESSNGHQGRERDRKINKTSNQGTYVISPAMLGGYNFGERFFRRCGENGGLTDGDGGDDEK